uniref:Glycoprotein-N-acetylgalactosamine 3-beta-galactosyltransferase 1 n=1 Tax=Rhabditophanes sp. KR3021 TaxID=114890 RepID=A0AC35U9K3_9BILA
MKVIYFKGIIFMLLLFLVNTDIVFDKFAEKLKKRVKIFCIVLTGKDFKHSRDIPQKNTWLRRCNKYVFASSVNDPSLPSIKLLDKHGYDFSYTKIRGAFKYVYERYGNQYDWFYKGESTYSVMENLRMFLLRKDPNKAKEYYGFRVIFRDRNIKAGYTTGGSGYVISKASLKKLVTKGFPNKKICRPLAPLLEDKEIGQCLANLNIRPVNSNDKRQRHLFIPGSLKEFASPLQNPRKLMFKRFSLMPIGNGISSLSKFPIAFHYIDNRMMYTLEYLLYHTKVAGLSSSVFNWFDRHGNNEKLIEALEGLKNISKSNY